MENLIKVETINGEIITIDGLPFFEFQQNTKNEFRAKALQLMQLTNEAFNKIIFDFGCKMENQNTHPNSKGITHKREFWEWLNHEIDCICYQGVDVLRTKQTAEKYRSIFLTGIEKFLIDDTKNDDLTALIKTI
ncbi:hypothetical protein [Flavobacterium davisii]|uniref:hypothetical protein n=1 Tax=Flavobacterium davisii TaxID=2906077 RepID=UPI0035D0AC31